MNKVLKRILIAVGAVVGGIAALFLLLYATLAVIGCAMYGECRRDREYVCNIPALGTGYAPQGIAYSAEKQVYIQTGYMPGNLSALYIGSGKDFREVKLLNAKGDPLKGHAGGITVTKDCVYIANGSNLHMYSLDELMNAGDKAVSVKQTFAVDNNAAYCYSNDEFLFVGEFYRAGNYETDEAHYYTTPTGELNRSIVSCYKLDGSGVLQTADGDDMPYPEYCISVTGLVQGFATDGETYMLSRSYGLVNSELEYHSAPKAEDGKTITVKFKNNKDAQERDVPLLYLDSSTLYKTLVLPSFSEDITIVDGRVVVTNEASANKYFVGKLFGANKVYSYPIYKKN